MAAPVVNSTHVLLNAVEDGADFADAAVSVRGGASIITLYDVNTGAAGNYGWDPANGAIRSQHAGADGDTELAGFMLADGAEFDQVAPLNATLDGSASAGGGKRLVYTHHYTSQGSAIALTAAVASGTGWMFVLFSDNASDDRTTDCRLWSGGGSDTIPTMFQPSPTTFIAVDPTHVASEVAIGPGTTINTGTNGTFDPTAIISAGWVHKATDDNNLYWQTVSRLGYYDAYTLLEGEEDFPCTLQDLLDKAYEENHFAMAIGGFAQFRVRMAIEFGDRDLSNTRPVYFMAENISVEFENAIQDTTESKIRVLHAPFNKIGIEEKLRAGDTWVARNVTWTSNTPWHLRMAATVGAVVRFVNCIIQNAGGTDDDCEIDEDVTIVGGLIDKCGGIAVNGGTLRDLAISNPVSTAAVRITVDSVLAGVAFSTEDSAKHAIVLPDPGGGTVDYDFDGLTFEGFNYAVRVLGSSGTVNINVLGGGNTPTISKGTVASETPTLLGTGWVDAKSAYTAEAGGGDSRRAVFMITSTAGGVSPVSATFGGQAMTLAAQNVEGDISLALWYIVETGNASAFSGSQVADAVFSGTPTFITKQFATYDHIWQTGQVVEERDVGQTVAASAAVSILNAIQSAAEIDTGSFSFAYTISNGANRLLVVGIASENGTVIPTGVTYGGQAMTKEAESFEAGTTGATIWYLDEAGVAAAASSTVVVSGLTGGAGEGRYGAICFAGVDQTTPFRDSGNDEDADASIPNLAMEPGDYIVGFHATTGGNTIANWTNDMALPDDEFLLDEADDPWAGAVKEYAGSSTVLGIISVGGGNARSCLVGAVIQPAPPQAGDLTRSVAVVDDGLVIAAAHFSTVVGSVAFGGDVTLRDEVDRAGETVAVADFVASADGTADAGSSNVITTTGESAQLLVAHFQPSDSQTGGPTVNVISGAQVTIEGLAVGTEVRAYVGAQPGTEIPSSGTDATAGTTHSFSHSEAGNAGYIMILKTGFVPRQINLTYASTDVTLPAGQRVDHNYSNP